MPVMPHIRCSAIGTLPGGEMFSWSFAIAKDPQLQGVSDSLAPFLEPNAAVWDDLAADIDAYHVDGGIAPAAILTRVKFASIVAGADGKPHYDAPPVERAINPPSGRAGGFVGASSPANQVALAVTLHTPGDLGRVKGRFYLPLPGSLPAVDGRIPEDNRDSIETASQTFINNVNNQPGIDVMDLRVVVASAGRYNKDGSVRVPGRNHVVTGVSVGRTLDTIRRRRNKLSEFRGTVSPVS